MNTYLHAIVNALPPERSRRATARSSLSTSTLDDDSSAVERQLAEAQRQLALTSSLLAEKQRECDELAEALAQQAHRDALTGLFNRRKFNALCAAEIARHARYDMPLALIMLDIDHFKDVNDRHGHVVGDRALVDVSRVLGEHVRASDALCRWGGEEFMILAPHLDLHSAMKMADKLRSHVAETDFELGRQITCSFGVAVMHSSDRVVDLVLRADACLYRAKRNGRNRVEAAEDEAPPALPSQH